MSLRTFHLLFILAAIVVADLFGAWAIWHYPEGSSLLTLWLGIATLIGGLALTVYAVLFVRGMDRAGIR